MVKPALFRLKTWRSNCSVMTNTPWAQLYGDKMTRRVTPDSDVDVIASLFRAALAQRLFAICVTKGGVVTGMGTKGFPMLDREGRAVTAGQ